MSFVKIPRKYSVKAGQNTKRKKKPGWDDTINDLSVHKATKDELLRRKEVATSQNIDLVKADQIKRNIHRASRHRTPGRKRQTALMREVLYDTSQLSDVLNKTDKMMSVVRDLFGDDPMKYKGLPNVTSAPNSSGYDGSLPIDIETHRPLKLDVLSDSIMDKSALNDSEYESEDEEDEDASYQPQLDFNRFQQLLTKCDQELEKEKRQNIGSNGSAADRLLREISARLGVQAPPENGTATPDEEIDSISATPVTSGAINDTLKVKKSKSRLTEQEKNEAKATNSVLLENTNDQSNLDDLREVLNGLEQNIGKYEELTGRENSINPSKEDSSTLTGFTGRLVAAVNKVSRYLKENELRIRAESMLREQLGQDVLCLKTLVDTLTTDIIATQEQYIALQSEFLKYKKESAEEIAAIKHGLQSRGISIHPLVAPTPQAANNLQHRDQNITMQTKSRQEIGGDLSNQIASSSNICYPKPLPTSQGVFMTQNQIGQNGQVSESALAQHLSESLRLNQVPGAHIPSVVPLSAPRQSDSPKVTGKSSTRISQAEREYDLKMQQQSTMGPVPQSNNNNAMSLSYNNIASNLPQQAADAATSQSIQFTHSSVNPQSSVPTGHSSYSAFQTPSGNSSSIITASSQIQQQQQTNDSQGLQVHNRAITQRLDKALGNYLPPFNQYQQQQQQFPAVPAPLNNITNYSTSIPVTHQPRPPVHENGISNIHAMKQVSIGAPYEKQDPMSSQLEKQIDELNRQHAEAQDKLQQLLQQQHSVENKLTTKKTIPVSPPISPITVDSDTENHFPHFNLPFQQGIPRQDHPKEIRIALPRVENIVELQNQN